MWLTPYSKRVDRDLTDWQAKGWVGEDGAAAIRASLETDDRPSRMPVVFAVLGAILLGFSAMAFVAANWADMSKGFRLTLLMTTMWTAYGVAAFLLIRKMNAFSEAALLVGIGVFGANIMLIAQMYHLPGDFPAGLLTWGLGALAVCLAANSKASLIAAQLLFGGWSLAAIDAQADPHWLYLISWLVTGGLALYLNARPAKHLVMISAYGWLLINAGALSDLTGYNPPEMITFALTGSVFAWILAIHCDPKRMPFSVAAKRYFSIATTILLWINLAFAAEELEQLHAMPLSLNTIALIPLLMFVFRDFSVLTGVDRVVMFVAPASVYITALISPGSETSGLWLTAPLFFGFAIWLVIFGTRQQDRVLINLGFAAFGLEAIYVYLETFGTLLDTAAFFALGGLLLIGGGIVWERLRRQITRNEEAGA